MRSDRGGLGASYIAWPKLPEPTCHRNENEAAATHSNLLALPTIAPGLSTSTPPYPRHQPNNNTTLQPHSLCKSPAASNSPPAPPSCLHTLVFTFTPYTHALPRLPSPIANHSPDSLLTPIASLSEQTSLGFDRLPIASPALMIPHLNALPTAP